MCLHHISIGLSCNGNVFSHVCQSVCSRGRVSMWSLWTCSNFFTWGPAPFHDLVGITFQIQKCEVGNIVPVMHKWARLIIALISFIITGWPHSSQNEIPCVFPEFSLCYKKQKIWYVKILFCWAHFADIFEVCFLKKWIYVVKSNYFKITPLPTSVFSYPK